VSIIAAATCVGVHADENAKRVKAGKEAEKKTPPREDVIPVNQRSETHHTLKVGNLKLDYLATAGVLPIKINEDGPECRIFFISYELEGKKDISRPITFVFNGGPGASSAYLHLGALGPRRVVFEDDGRLPGQPARLTENDDSWLVFTDLVFIDPVGTGFSRCICKKCDGKENKAETKVWGVREDLISLAKFIRLYLTRKERWLSPKFLAGESYGGFRVAALAGLLQSDFGISPTGLILVSPALEFGLLAADKYGLLRWIVPIPSYAATAQHYQKKETTKIANQKNCRQALEEVEHFALKELLPGLAEGETSELNGRLGSYIGLSEERLSRLQGRIPPQIFAKEFLKKLGRLISVYDGTWSSIDPDPASPLPPVEDPLLVKINTILTPAFNSYVRKDLQFETDIPYEVLNKQISKKWDWHSGLDSEQGFVGVAEELKKSMCVNTDLKVLIVHGIFDFVTPYFGSVLVTKQMSLDQVISSNMILKFYDGGHMFYTHRNSRQEFFKDAKQFFQSAANPG